MSAFNNPKELEEYRQQVVEKNAGKVDICVSGGTCGRAAGALHVQKALNREIEQKALGDSTILRVTGCHGFCNMEPMVVITHPDANDRIMYRQVCAEDAAEIIDQSVCENGVVERLVYENPKTDEKIPEKDRIPFFHFQTRRLFAWNERIDPLDIEEYIAMGGYRALAKTLDSEPEDVIEQIRRAGLRGRGGAGFPTAMKWQFTRGAVEEATGETIEPARCYVVCNADEGDPGAYMDRSILEGNPHSVIEGMIIGAHAMASGFMCKPQGYIYVRAEYPMAIHHLKQALQQARDMGFLGEDILGSGVDFDIDIVRGAGAFVCGEETALLESVEDRIGEPRPKPPYPVESGLWGWPTVLNNVKTWALARYIMDKGPDEFANVGAENNEGTMVFALVGNVQNSGLVEVPMGITLREIVEDIGHGVPDGHGAKAVQTGGPSGGCLPAEKFDLTVDYESLTEAGTIMGSGGMIVMDQQTCMVDTARYFLNFAANESCGKCTPCREGVPHMFDIVNDIVEGRGKPEYLDMLERMGNQILKLSFCGLGKTAPNPALSTLRYFRHEYEAHLEGRCPAKVCKALITYRIIPENCTGCTACARKCPVGAISGEKQQVHEINPEICTKCGICLKTCRFNAIEVE